MPVIDVDETLMTDTFTVFDDSSVAGDTGQLTDTLLSDLVRLWDGSPFQARATSR